MLTMDEIILKLQDRNLTKISEVTGISVVSLSRIKNGHMKYIQSRNAEKLSEYFEKMP